MLICLPLAVGTFGHCAEQPKPTREPKPAKVDPHRELAINLAEQASLSTAGLDAASQAALLFVVGTVYANVDKTKAQQLLEAAYQNAGVGIQARPKAVKFMYPDLIAATVKVEPRAVEQSLPAPPFHDYALKCLIDRYLIAHDRNRATELFLQMDSDAQMTVPARDLLMTSPNLDERNRVFGAVLRAYARDDHQQVGTGMPEDLGTLVVRFWRRLDSHLVLEAVDELLKQAKDGDDVLMTSVEGTVSFTAYQFRLFQLMPALEALDPQRAESLLREQSKIAALMKKYPQGQRSADPTLSDKVDEKPAAPRQTSYRYVSKAVQPSRAVVESETDRIEKAISSRASENPGDAIAAASQIPDSLLRARTLVDIARVLSQEDSSSASQALRKSLEKKFADNNAWLVMKDAAAVAQKIHRPDLAKDAIQAGLKAVRGLYNDDSDSDNPNLALKLYWPSVRAYRELISEATNMSYAEAVSIVDELSDPEVKALEQVFLAAKLLKVELPNTSPMVMREHKRN